MQTRARSKARKTLTKTAKSSRSKSARRSLRYGPRNARVVAAVGPTVGLGTSLTTNLRTSFFANVSSLATGIYTAYLKPGSAYDPTGDIAALQPALFDQYAAVFARYKVNKFTVSIKIIGVQSGTGYTFNAAAYPSTDSTALSTYQAAASQPWAKTVVGTFGISGATPTFGGPAQYVSMYFDGISNDAVVGVKSDTFDSGAVIGADPPAGQYAVMPIYIQQNQSNVANYVLHIDVWQNVTFSQRKPVGDA